MESDDRTGAPLATKLQPPKFSETSIQVAKGECIAPSPRQTGGIYTPPSWAGPPPSTSYYIEVMKNGSIIDTIENSVAKDHITFGRAPDNDVVLDHPSSSRLHAVLQFQQETGLAYLYDPGSTHGVMVHKKRIPANEYYRLNVGDMFKLGLSSRIYIFGGPNELLPEEGPSRLERALLQAITKRKEREEAIGKAQMQAALQKGGHATVLNVDEDGDDINWRVYAETHRLSEKQQKLADKIRKREARIQNLQNENERIRSKQHSMEDLTSGQLATLARNEEAIEKAMADLEEVEDLLSDAIRDVVHADAGRRKNKKARREEEDYSGGSDGGEDEIVYDKTKRVDVHGRNSAEEFVKDAQALVFDMEALIERKKKVEDLIHKTKGPEQKILTNTETGTDSLDAYMTDQVAAHIRRDALESLEGQLNEVVARIAQTETLLKVADPEGYYSKDGIKRTRNISSLKEKGADEERSADVADVADVKKAQDDAAKKAKARMDARRSEIAAALNQQKQEKKPASSLPFATEEENILEDLALLRDARVGMIGVGQDEDNLDGWQPPEGQKGDGQSFLNQKYGY